MEANSMGATFMGATIMGATIIIWTTVMGAAIMGTTIMGASIMGAIAIATQIICFVRVLGYSGLPRILFEIKLLIFHHTFTKQK